MKTVFTIIFFLFSVTFVFAQQQKPVTQLKNGYKIKFSVDEHSITHLNLYKENKLIKVVVSSEAQLPARNLGYVAFDFQDMFLLVHHYGSGEPDYINLIRKQDGKVMLYEDVKWITATTAQNVLLYNPTRKSDKIVLHSILTGEEEQYDLPQYYRQKRPYEADIEIKKLSPAQLNIVYPTRNSNKTKVYNRLKASIIGTYILKDKEDNCRLKIIITKRNNKLYYNLITSKRNKTGIIELTKDGDQYISFKGVPADINNGDLQGSLFGNEIWIQNKGNAMDPYTRLLECKSASINLIKQ